MTSTTFRTPAALRRTVRSIALTYRLPAEDRARIVLSLSETAAAALNAGRPVTLTATNEAGDDGADRLTLALGLPHQDSHVVPGELPLPGEAGADGTVVWRVPLPPARSPLAAVFPQATRACRADTAAAPRGGEADLAPADTALLEEELRAALARADRLADEHRKLKHELAETNSGVLALYVQLEERDEELRKAHGRTLRALEDALRPRPLHVDGLDLAVHYAPASDDTPTGGDLYDWFVLPVG
ncbi:Serine/threonine-protein phosphatase OS=Streptomyces alboniger OX=132473 GN=CP975_04245 PE=4 SV=1 [Streptomyces alboniger]